ncbi:sensor histidine kinase [Streptomyces sp. NPDC058794]|uniref:sensor histidine kinase n=1 Tax=Streptomyces TaxID=1883 RepID=UPI00367FE967
MARLWRFSRLVSAFSGDGTDARLEADAAVRDARLAPEVETPVHRVVQEALTNVRRQAHGSDVAVRIDADGDRLRVEVRNSAPPGRPSRLAVAVGSAWWGGGEWVEAVEGTLDTGSIPDGGWYVTAAFPTLAAVAACAERARTRRLAPRSGC